MGSNFLTMRCHGGHSQKQKKAVIKLARNKMGVCELLTGNRDPV